MPKIGSLIAAPHAVLALVCAGLAAFLTLRVTLPIGPFYWDLYLYFDAANRILDGQVPGLDFFTPVGPLGYWLFALVVRLFPHGQPLLVAQWSLLLVTAPLLGLVLAELAPRSRALAFVLLVPFLVFSILPFNVEEYYSYPGVDGYGIYNRQICHILYVLMAALVFSRSQRVLLTVVAGTMLSLFLVKITGFVAGAMLCALAFAAGRVALRTTLGALLACLVVLLALELRYGIVWAYLNDIVLLLEMNEGSLLPRFLQAGSIHFVVVAPLAALTLAVAVVGARTLAADARAVLGGEGLAAAARLFDHDVFWLAVAAFAGLFFETQNTGGQAFIFVWPALVQVLLRTRRGHGRAATVVFALVAASAMPTSLEVIHRAARAFVGQLQYVDLARPDLGPLGAISQRSEMMERAARMVEVYRRFPETWQFLADRQELPSFTLYTEPDYRVTWLMAADEAVGAIKAYEAANGVRFDTIMSLNFVNPFPWLLERRAPTHIAIGADPFRAVPDPDAAVLASVQESDLVLYPRCPITSANQRLLDLYLPGLGGHTKIGLSPCWDAYVRTSMMRKP